MNSQILEMIKEKDSANYTDLCQRWEQASQMRKWTGFIKLQISERIKKEVQ